MGKTTNLLLLVLSASYCFRLQLCAIFLSFTKSLLFPLRLCLHNSLFECINGNLQSPIAKISPVVIIFLVTNHGPLDPTDAR
uniref:Uncharacterized protein n=1 Tax=Arundo donax TaxID=35708 RepID=A0A0A9GJB8_ARUDO